MSELRIRLLGTPTIEVDNKTITLERRKSIALLAYIAVTAQPISRDMLATLFWPEDDTQHGRRYLRRALACLNETPIRNWIEATRDSVMLKQNDDLWLDTQHFSHLLDRDSSLDTLAEAVALYSGDFMSGFTLRDSAEFDNWQSIHTQIFQQRLITALEQLVTLHIDAQNTAQALVYAQRWRVVDVLHEAAQRQFMRLCAATGQRNTALREFEIYEQRLDAELGISPSENLIALYEAIKNDEPISLRETTLTTGSLIPALPKLFVGREDILTGLKNRLGELDPTLKTQTTLAIQGWPGIGKTTLASVLAHDTDLRERFPDGILFTSLGEQPNLFAELMNWATVLKLEGLTKIKSDEDLSKRIAAVIRDKRVLLIVDDIWDMQHAVPFSVGGKHCAMIATTRMNDIACALVAHPDDVYRLPVLDEDQSLALLHTLAPQMVEQNPAASRELAIDLEGLPLALQVAGRLLHAEMRMGWGVTDLLHELREGTQLLDTHAPTDHIAMGFDAPPTIRILLQRSTDRLDQTTRKHFALLGAFAPKPATFDLDAMKAAWQVPDPKPSVRILVARGLLEPTLPGRFQMHAVLVMHAKSLFGG